MNIKNKNDKPKQHQELGFIYWTSYFRGNSVTNKSIKNKEHRDITEM